MKNPSKIFRRIYSNSVHVLGNDYEEELIITVVSRPGYGLGKGPRYRAVIIEANVAGHLATSMCPGWMNWDHLLVWVEARVEHWLELSPNQASRHRDRIMKAVRKHNTLD